jgi:hypothetical protein
MAYAVVMETLAALPSDMWEPTPPEAQTYMRALEARRAALEAKIQMLQGALGDSYASAFWC